LDLGGGQSQAQDGIGPRRATGSDRKLHRSDPERIEHTVEELAGRRAEIFNSDRGVSYTSRAFTGRLEEAGVAIGMDGRGRALDNVFVERLWWTVKYEAIERTSHQPGKKRNPMV
jgi:transposase InsO family protein